MEDTNLGIFRKKVEKKPNRGLVLPLKDSERKEKVQTI